MRKFEEYDIVNYKEEYAHEWIDINELYIIMSVSYRKDWASSCIVVKLSDYEKYSSFDNVPFGKWVQDNVIMFELNKPYYRSNKIKKLVYGQSKRRI